MNQENAIGGIEGAGLPAIARAVVSAKAAPIGPKGLS
jgi:hypothetical protein